MSLLVVGLSHHSAPVALRERLAVPAAGLPEVLAELRAVAGVREVVLVSTCNRTEIYAEVEDVERDGARLREFLSALARLELAELDRHLYVRPHAEAVRHVFRVTSSLDSLVVGESQVLGQVKAAFAAAQAAEAARGMLGRLMERAFAVAKRIRTETSIGASSLSVGGAAVDLARTIFGDLKGRSVLLVGAGKMGRLALRHLCSAGVQTLFIANRTPEHARRVLEEHRETSGYYVPLDGLIAAIEQVDIVLSSIQMGRYALERSEAELLLRRRGGRPLFLVDIAVPRSLDPRVHSLENAFLYDIDDLEGIVASNHKARRDEAATAERAVEQEAASFVASLREIDVAPAIRALLERFEAVRRAELERHLNGRPDLTPETRAALEAATRAMCNKLAHGPIRELKRAVSQSDGQATIDAIHRALIEDRPRRGGGRGEPG